MKTLREHIDFDAMLACAGRRGADGVVTLAQVLGSHKIDAHFVAEYADVADEDVAGQLFAAYPRTVQTISVCDYRDLGERETGSVAGARAGRLMADYLEKYGFQHLMLAGLGSSYGLAWITFYRHDAAKPFTPEDAEWARYLVPGLLYQWQRACRLCVCTELPSKLLPLTSREMQIAILSAQGLLPKTIADRFQLSTSTVREVIQNIRARLGIIGRKMTSDDMERHLALPAPPARNGATIGATISSTVGATIAKRGPESVSPPGYP
ncbi:helix-turn-helix transcriptional regulator [Massilia glaciei]|uniref:helix-turn-helix transcriptional regulator n=1 Tax=Massilia glaciei TaxID=1524097 RepID=UPI0015E805C2|nr:helix-turn-helix transcriptional regulator [Massilia glaciei]